MLGSDDADDAADTAPEKTLPPLLGASVPQWSGSLVHASPWSPSTTTCVLSPHPSVAGTQDLRTTRKHVIPLKDHCNVRDKLGGSHAET